MEQAIKQEFENLAAMVKSGFDETAKKADVDARFEQIDQRLEQIDQRLDHVDARLLVIERDIAEIRSHFVYREEFEDLMARVKYLEKKLNIESGK